MLSLASRRLGLPPTMLLSLLALFLFYGLADLITTAFDAASGKGWEGNPLASFILAHWGLLGLGLLKLTILAACTLMALYASPALRRLLTAVFFAFSALFALVSFSNIYGLITGTDLFHALLIRLILLFLGR